MAKNRVKWLYSYIQQVFIKNSPWPGTVQVWDTPGIKTGKSKSPHPSGN